MKLSYKLFRLLLVSAILVVVHAYPNLKASLVASNPATISKLKTTVIITVQEAMAAMKKASGLQLAMPKG